MQLVRLTELHSNERVLVSLTDNHLEVFEKLGPCRVGELCDLFLDAVEDVLGKPGEKSALRIRMSTWGVHGVSELWNMAGAR